MVRLKDRNFQIPGGLRFLQPETGWKPYPFSSFDTIVRQLIVHRSANPFLRDKNGWPVDYDTVANEVDLFNATICKEMGWGNYILDDSGVPPPTFQGPRGKAAGRVGAVIGKMAAGAATLASWLGAGGNPVPQPLAQARAEKCVQCKKNGSGGLEEYFTKKASAIVKKQLEERKRLTLETTVDDQLGVCTACACPLKLKVHTPLSHILKNIPKKSRDDLWSECWILTESK